MKGCGRHIITLAVVIVFFFALSTLLWVAHVWIEEYIEEKEIEVETYLFN